MLFFFEQKKIKSEKNWIWSKSSLLDTKMYAYAIIACGDAMRCAAVLTNENLLKYFCETVFSPFHSFKKKHWKRYIWCTFVCISRFHTEFRLLISLWKWKSTAIIGKTIRIYCEFVENANINEWFFAEGANLTWFSSKVLHFNCQHLTILLEGRIFMFFQWQMSKGD